MDNIAPHTPITREWVRFCVLTALSRKNIDYRYVSESEVRLAVDEVIRRVEKMGYLVVGNERRW